jgi:hypothetical protein
MSKYIFGQGKGHMPKLAREIAHEHGAVLVNYLEHNGEKRHWFSFESLGAPFDEARKQVVLAALRRAGLVEESERQT